MRIFDKSIDYSKKSLNFALEITDTKESEVIMPEYEHNREERMEAVVKAAKASKESAMKFLIEAGILEPSGELAPHLR